MRRSFFILRNFFRRQSKKLKLLYTNLTLIGREEVNLVNELKLIRKAIKGNKDCLEELLVLHGDQLYRTAYVYVRNREDVLDVVQEASYKAFLFIGQLKNEKFFFIWLTKILLNCSYEVVKKRNKEWPSNEIVEVTEEKSEKRVEDLDLIEAVSR